MTPPRQPTNYQQLAQKIPPPPSSGRTTENELDVLLGALARQDARPGSPPVEKVDPIQQFRVLVMNELIPAFVELVNKYAARGVSMDMDASNLLKGGRDICFEFRLGDYRTQLTGTVMSDTIAFQETRYFPHVRGELVSGPMLSLRRLNAQSFREFVCDRLAILARTAMRKA